MYRILIVDDEMNIREGMKNGIDWGTLGYTVVGSAANGLEALEQIQKTDPNVVLSDIRMPFMDGVELMKYLNENYPKIKIVILSGYNDFEYLNMSIKNNVCEYLLKPTDTDEFEAVFTKIKKKLDEENAHMEEFNQNLRYKIDNILKNYLAGFGNDRDTEFINKMGLFSDCFWVASFKFVNDQETDSEMLDEIICLLSVNREISYGFLDEINNPIMIVKSTDYEKTEEILSDKISLVKAEIGVDLLAGVSKKSCDIADMGQCYEQALSTICTKSWDEKKQIAFYDDLKDGCDKAQISFDYEKISTCILAGKSLPIQDEIDRVFLDIENNIAYKYSDIEYIIIEFLLYLSRWSKQYHISFEEMLLENKISYRNVRKNTALDKRKGIVEKAVFALVDSISAAGEKTAKNRSLVAQIKDYVDHDFAENFMSLDYISDKVSKSTAYVSKLFKDEIGCNFSEYVTNKRLEMGKELLGDSQKKIYEISEKIGYADVSNFIKLFRKKYGISPGNYRSFIGGAGNEE